MNNTMINRSLNLKLKYITSFYYQTLGIERSVIIPIYEMTRIIQYKINMQCFNVSLILIAWFYLNRTVEGWGD